MINRQRGVQERGGRSVAPRLSRSKLNYLTKPELVAIGNRSGSSLEESMLKNNLIRDILALNNIVLIEADLRKMKIRFDNQTTERYSNIQVQGEQEEEEVELPPTHRRRTRSQGLLPNNLELNNEVNQTTVNNQAQTQSSQTRGGQQNLTSQVNQPVPPVQSINLQSLNQPVPPVQSINLQNLVPQPIPQRNRQVGSEDTLVNGLLDQQVKQRKEILELQTVVRSKLESDKMFVMEPPLMLKFKTASTYVNIAVETQIVMRALGSMGLKLLETVANFKARKGEEVEEGLNALGKKIEILISAIRLIADGKGVVAAQLLNNTEILDYGMSEYLDKAKQLVVREQKYERAIAKSSVPYGGFRSGNRFQGGGGFRRRGNNNNRIVTCFKCGKTGHYSFNCPQKVTTGKGKFNERKSGGGLEPRPKN